MHHSRVTKKVVKPERVSSYTDTGDNDSANDLSMHAKVVVVTFG